MCSRLRYRRRFGSKKEADGYEAYVKATGGEPAHLTGAQTDTYAAVAAQFQERSPDWFQANGDANAARTNAQRFDYAIQELGHLDIKAVSTSVLDKFVDKLLKRGPKRPGNRTVNRYLDAVAKVLRFAHQRSKRPDMPFVPRLENIGKTRKPVTQAAEAAICAWLEGHGKADHAFLVHVLGALGLRTGELWEITPEQIEDEGILLYEEQTKTDAPRWAYLNPIACRKLRAMVAANALPNHAQLWRSFKQAAEAVGESADLTLCCLRHARVTRMLSSDVDPMNVAKSVRHKSLQTTMGYFHPDKEALSKAAKKVPYAWGETEPKGAVVEFQPKKSAG